MGEIADPPFLKIGSARSAGASPAALSFLFFPQYVSGSIPVVGILFFNTVLSNNHKPEMIMRVGTTQRKNIDACRCFVG